MIATRKVIGPGGSDFEWAAGALPSFLWWDIACRIGDDRNPSDAITEFAPFLVRHAVPAALALSQERGLPEEVISKIGTSWRRFARDAGSESALEVAGKIIELASGLDALGLGLVVKEFRAAAGWLRERQARQSQLVADVVLDSQRVPLAQSQADLLESMSSGVLPVVMAVEDLHFMGDDTRALLLGLQHRDADVLVLGTVWPESRNRTVFRAWRQEAETVVKAHEVLPPRPFEAVAMVRALAPRTKGAEARRITDKWSNPFALLALLSLARVRERIASGNGALVFDEDLCDEPLEVERLYQQRLAEVPADVAEALALAAGMLPSAALVQLAAVVHDANGVLDVDHRYVVTARLDMAVLASRLDEGGIVAAQVDRILAAVRGASAIHVLSEYGFVDWPAAKLDDVATYLEAAGDVQRGADVRAVGAALGLG